MTAPPPPLPQPSAPPSRRATSQFWKAASIFPKRDLVRAEMERLERLFNQLDANKDGRIDTSELTDGLKKMGYYHVTKEDIEEFLRKSDVNQSGDLDKAEFVSYLQEHEKQLKFVFSTLDVNQDGKLCIQEIIGAFKNVGIFVTPDEAKSLLKRINLDDKSLEISFEEWRDYLLFQPSADLKDIIGHWRRDTCIDLGEDLGIPDDFDEDEEGVACTPCMHLMAGGVAGAVSRSCTAPLDRLKIMLQVHGGRKSLSLLHAATLLLREGGVRGMWRGNGVNILKIAPESAIKFGFYDAIKRYIRGDEERQLKVWERFLAGSLAGGASQTIIYPLEVLKIRMALRKTNEYRNVFDLVREMYRTDGPKVFYRGYIPNLLGILPYAGIDLAVYETLKRHYLQHYMDSGASPPAYSLLGFGTFSSCCGQVAAYPLALVRTKLQAQAGRNLPDLPAEQKHAIGLFRYIVRTEGIKGLYRGILPNFCKVAPAVSISYYVYERTREYLGVEMV